MKMITAYIQPKRLDSVRQVLSEIDINGVSVTEVKGFGRQKGHTELYRGAEYVVEFLPKVKLEIAITDEQVDEVIETISSACKINGGKIGDGKIFVTSLEQVVRIRTGESGPEALYEQEMENQILELQYAMDTFYFLVMGALVMWMAAGFSMLEAGLVRSKNTAEILTKNIGLFAIACTMYMVYGYDLMYGGGAFLSGISGQGETYSNASDFYFQVVFVATAMSIVSGAVAERMKLFTFFAFAVIFTTIIYPLEGSWTWGGNDVFGLYNLGDFGFYDFAGSGIVHMAGAAAAIAGVLILGPRKGKYDKDGNSKPILGANLPLATLGTFILWLGWFGFNGGSVLAMASKESADAVAMVLLIRTLRQLEVLLLH